MQEPIVDEAVENPTIELVPDEVDVEKTAEELLDQLVQPVDEEDPFAIAYRKGYERGYREARKTTLQQVQKFAGTLSVPSIQNPSASYSRGWKNAAYKLYQMATETLSRTL